MDGKHNLLSIMEPLVDKNLRYRFPLDKFSIFNRSSALKNEAINSLNNSLEKK